MRHIYKYIVLIFAICLITVPSYAFKKRSTKSRVSASQRQKAQNKKSKHKKNKKYKKNAKSVSLKFSKKVVLDQLLKETSVPVQITKVDSIPEKVITILSAFKPQLKNSVKIGFVNATAKTDTMTISLNYQVPSQNLSFQYRPISLVPRSFKTEALIPTKNAAYVKLGIGNYTHHFIDLNISTTDASKNNHSFSIYNEAYNGLHHLQTLRETGIRYIGDLHLNTYNTLQTQVFFQQSNRYRYGMIADSSSVSTSNFEQNFTHVGVSFGLINYNLSPSKWVIAPVVKIENMKGNSAISNIYLELNSPMYVALKNNKKLNLNLIYSYNQNHVTEFDNKSTTFLRFDPSITLSKWNAKMLVGISPMILNGDFKVFPNVNFETKLKDTHYVIQTGWTTLTNNTNYGNLVMQNPWITPISQLEITSQEKKYFTVHITADRKLNYSVGISLNDYRNLPLFNRVVSADVANAGLKYQAIFEKRAIMIQLDASMRYQFSDHLLVSNQLSYKQFNSLRVNDKPWGILPFEFKSNLNWRPTDKWTVDGSVQFWSGADQLNDANKAFTTKNAFVLNAGFAYKLTNSWSVWAKGENLLDKPYERWADYPSLGVQIIAGVVYSFLK